MKTAEEKSAFYSQGFLHVRGVLNADELLTIRAEFDKVWETEGARVDQHKLL